MPLAPDLLEAPFLDRETKGLRGSRITSALPTNRPVSACSGVVGVTATFHGQALPRVLFHFARTVRRSDG
jgi:hypothetical protein